MYNRCKLYSPKSQSHHLSSLYNLYSVRHPLFLGPRFHWGKTCQKNKGGKKKEEKPQEEPQMRDPSPRTARNATDVASREQNNKITKMSTVEILLKEKLQRSDDSQTVRRDLAFYQSQQLCKILSQKLCQWKQRLSMKMCVVWPMSTKYTSYGSNSNRVVTVHNVNMLMGVVAEAHTLTNLSCFHRQGYPQNKDQDSLR